MPEQRSLAALTAPLPRGYGPRPVPAARSHIPVALLLLGLACKPVPLPSAPLTAFTFPTGVGVANGDVFVVSSNFDLTYQDDVGGSLISFDPNAWIQAPGGATPTDIFADQMTFPSFGGPVVVAGSECGQATTPQVLFASRLSGDLYRVYVNSDGKFSCNASASDHNVGDCAVPIASPGQGDPERISLACDATAAQPFRAFVGWLRPQVSGNCPANFASANSCGMVTELDLTTPSGSPVSGPVAFNEGGVAGLTYDVSSNILYFVTSQSFVGSVDLSSEGTGPGSCSLLPDQITNQCPMSSLDLSAAIPAAFPGALQGSIQGIEGRTVALSTPQTGLPRRLYVLVNIVDPVAESQGIQVFLGGALVVMQFTPSPVGPPLLYVQRPPVPLPGTMMGDMVVLPREGQRDLLAITATNSGQLFFYDDDDDVQAVTGTYGRAENGLPIVGNGPFALAPETKSDGTTRLWVTAFFGPAVTAVDIANPNDPDPNSGGSSCVGTIPPGNGLTTCGGTIPP